MKTKSVLIMFVVLFGSNILLAQNNNQIKPKVDIKVTKKTDENGNIISYDSTYVKTWSSANISTEKLDSLLSEFNIKDEQFLMPKSNFFNDDYFSAIPDFKQIEEMLKKMIEEFNSISNMFVSPKCNPIITNKQINKSKAKKKISYTPNIDEFM